MENELEIVLRRLWRTLLAFMMVLAIGTIGYQFVAEDVSWFDGLYMTVVTVTTIGFSEVVTLDGNIPGRIFTMLLAFMGIGILTYGFTNLAALIIERDLSQPLKRKRMERIIQKLNDHYIVCGGSQVGLHVAEELESTQRPFVIGDIDGNVVESLKGRFKYGKTLQGDCTDDRFLLKLNIQKAKGIFITTRDDNLNLVVCVTALQLHPKLRVICHCKNLENKRKLLSVGATKVVSPYSIGGMRMASEMVRPTVTSFLDIMLRDTNRNLRIEEVTIPESFVGKPLRSLPIEDLEQTLVLAIKEKQSWKYNPRDDYQLTAQSSVIVMTSPEELQALEAYLKK